MIANHDGARVGSSDDTATGVPPSETKSSHVRQRGAFVLAHADAPGAKECA